MTYPVSVRHKTQLNKQKFLFKAHNPDMDFYLFISLCEHYGFKAYLKMS
jgi:hypothetical protein